MMLRLFTLALCLISNAAIAHEFWIEPAAGRIAPGDKIIADIRVGENLSGAANAFIPRNFNVFDIHNADGIRPIEGRIGDRPALSIEAGNGLHIARFWSTISTITWRRPENFQDFLQYDGVEWVAEMHRARGLPDAGFSEHFVRHAKALIAVGDAKGTDFFTGMPLEIISQTNPFTDAGVLILDVFWQAEAIENVQIAHFHRASNGDVSRSLYRTDDAGRVYIPRPAEGFSLFSAVHMDARNDRNTPWISHWASLSFNLEN